MPEITEIQYFIILEPEETKEETTNGQIAASTEDNHAVADIPVETVCQNNTLSKLIKNSSQYTSTSTQLI